MRFTGIGELDVVLVLIVGMPALVILVEEYFALRRNRLAAVKIRQR